MADEIVNVVYTADVSQYAQSMSEAVQATEHYAQSVDNAVGKVSKSAATISKAMMNIGGGVMTGGKGKMSPATQIAAGYEQQLSLLSARARISNQNINELGKNVKKLARDFPIGMGDAVQQYEAVQRMGKSGKELKNITEQMTKLGAATGEMGAGLTTSMGQFTRTFQQFDAKGVSNISDSVATLSSKFGTSATSMLDFANAVAPLSKQLGMGSSEVLGFATAFGRAGEDGYRAANVFNRMLADMEKAIRTGAPQISTYAEAVGMTTESFKALAEQDPTEAMTKFFEAINENGNDSIRILEDLGMEGVRTYKSIVSVASQGDIREIQEQAASAYGTGSSAVAAEEAFNGLNDSMGRTKESLDQLVASSATPYVKAMGGVADATANVTGKMAEFAESDKMQSLIQMMMLGGIAAIPAKAMFGLGTAVQTGKFATNLAASTGGLAAARQSPALAWGRQHSGMLGMAGMGGMMMGGMMGNDMLTYLGMGAMLFGPGQGKLAKVARRGAGALLDVATTTQGAEKWGEIAGVKEGERVRERSGKAFGRAQRLADWTAGVRPDQRAAGYKGVLGDLSFKRWDYGHVYTPEEFKEAEENRKAARKATMESGTVREQRMLNARRAAGFFGQQAIAGGSAIAGMAGAGMAALGPTLAIGAVAGGGAYGYMQYQKGKEATADPSALAKLAQAANLATKGLEQFTSSMQTAEKGANSVADAFTVTDQEMRMVQSKDYQAAFIGAKKGRGESEILSSMIATGANQSAAVQQRIVNDVAKLLGQGKAEEMGRTAFGPGAEKSAMAAAGEMSQSLKWGGGAEGDANRNWESWRYFLTGRRQESIDQMQAAAENMRAQFTEDTEIYGKYYALSSEMTTGIEDVAMAAAMAGDERTAEAAITGLSGMGDQRAADVKDRAKEIEGTIDEATGKAYTAVQAYEMAIKESDWYTETEEELKQAIITGQSALDDLAASGLAGMDQLATASEKSQQTGITIDKMLAQYDAYNAAAARKVAVGESNLTELEKSALAAGPGAFTAEEATAVRAYTQYESPKVQAEQQARFYRASVAAGGTGGEIAGAITKFEADRAKGGEISAMNLDWMFQRYSGAMQSAQMREGGSITSGQARQQRMAAQEEMLTGVTYDKEGNPIFSQNPMLAKQQGEAWMAREGEREGIAKEQRSFLMSDWQLQRQQGISEREFGISAGQARADAAKSERRGRESLERQQGRAREDFAKQNQRQLDDFNKSRQRSQDDFNKQMLRSEQDYQKQSTRQLDDFNKNKTRSVDDYHKSVGRATEDFNRQMERAGEEMARSMLNPMERIGAARTWSAGGLAGNLKEQNEAVKKQLETLDKLKEQGLSQEAIDLLGLANAQNARQTISLGGMSAEEIAALNEQAGQRMDLGQQINEEQVGYRQAYEDFAREIARQEEDFNLSLARMDEDFALSRARAAEDFQTNIARSTEDFNLSMQRSQEDFYLGMERAQTDFDLSLVRQNEDFAISIAQMWEDLETGLTRQGEAMRRGFEDAKENLKASFMELNLTPEEREAAFAAAWDNEFNGYEGHMQSRLEIATNHLTTTNETAITELGTTSTTAQGNLETTSNKAQTDISDTAEDTRDELDTTTGDVETYITQVSETAQNQIADIKAVADIAVANIVLAAETAKTETDLLIEGIVTKAEDEFAKIPTAMETAMEDAVTKMIAKLDDIPAKMEEAMGEFAWLLEEKSQVENKAPEILIKMDEDSFKKTWGKMLEDLGYAGPGEAAGSGGRGGPGTTPGVTPGSVPMMNKYATIMEGHIGDSKLSSPDRGTWDVHNYCLRNAIEMWKVAGGKPTKYLPSAKAHANTIRGAMHQGYDAPAGSLYWWGMKTYGHVAVADGKGGAINNWGGNVIEKNRASGMSPGTYYGWTYPTALKNGAIISGSRQIMAGESGPEALLPLNDRGVDFLMNLLKRYSANGDSEWTRTREFGIQHTDNSTHIVNDTSVHTGDVTVVAADTDQFYASIRRKQARERLGSRV